MEISTKHFDQLINSDIPVMIEFWGSWCPPCQHMKSVMTNLEEEFNGKLHIVSLNIDKNPKPSYQYDITGVPTFIIFKKGEILHREIGAKSEHQLREIIENVINREP